MDDTKQKVVITTKVNDKEYDFWWHKDEYDAMLKWEKDQEEKLRQFIINNYD